MQSHVNWKWCTPDEHQFYQSGIENTTADAVVNYSKEPAGIGFDEGQFQTPCLTWTAEVTATQPR